MAMSQKKRFALIGAAGFVAPGHFEAIKTIGGELIACCDLHDSVQRLDSYFPTCRFFDDPRPFGDFLREATGAPVDFLTVCTPDYLHHPHIELGLEAGCDVICEKPLCRTTAELDQLRAAERRTGHTVYGIQQLRYHPALTATFDAVSTRPPAQRSTIDLVYVTHRGPWYDLSWRGDPEKGAGLITDIGIHFLDMLLWIWGPLERSSVHEATARRASGSLTLQKADVRWYLSLDRDDMRQFGVEPGLELRRISVDGRAFEVSRDFHSLHTECYRAILAGNGLRIDTIYPTIALCEEIQRSARGLLDS